MTFVLQTVRTGTADLLTTMGIPYLPITAAVVGVLALLFAFGLWGPVVGFLWSWLYYILAVVVAAVVGVWYMLRRGINRIKPDPIKDIPTPPLTHALLGHPDKMLHPLKHELRLEVRNAARTPVHQVAGLLRRAQAACV